MCTEWGTASRERHAEVCTPRIKRMTFDLLMGAFSRSSTVLPLAALPPTGCPANPEEVGVAHNQSAEEVKQDTREVTDWFRLVVIAPRGARAG